MSPVTVVIVALGLPALLSALGPMSNCSLNRDGRTLSCFSCMGRDMENCEHGLTCCSGSCFKLEDKKHNVIVKGCTTADEEDASMKVRTLEVPLYWADNEKVTGESFFCKSTEFCNSAPVPPLLLSIGAVLLAKWIVA